MAFIDFILNRTVLSEAKNPFSKTISFFFVKKIPSWTSRTNCILIWAKGFDLALRKFSWLVIAVTSGWKYPTALRSSDGLSFRYWKWVWFCGLGSNLGQRLFLKNWNIWVFSLKWHKKAVVQTGFTRNNFIPSDPEQTVVLPFVLALLLNPLFNIGLSLKAINGQILITVTVGKHFLPV